MKALHRYAQLLPTVDRSRVRRSPAVSKKACRCRHPKLDRRLCLLDTIITLASLLGLFGTSSGMFRASSVVAKPGHAPMLATGGVADALVSTTGLRLVHRHARLLTFNAFNNQVRMILPQLDSVKTISCPSSWCFLS